VDLPIGDPRFEPLDAITVKLFRRTPKPLPKATLGIPFDALEPAVPGESQYREWPEWFRLTVLGLLVVLAIVFFPVTLVLFWGARYRGWFEGGHGGWEEDLDDEDDINWVRDHEERSRETSP
jgi:nitrogen fixation-related uncharacterized protein